MYRMATKEKDDDCRLCDKPSPTGRYTKLNDINIYSHFTVVM